MKTRNKLLTFLAWFLASERGDIENALADDDKADDKADDKKDDDKKDDDKKDDLDPLYGDLKVEWPEGIDENLKKELSIKPFVGKDGKIQIASLLNSYFQTKKMVGMDKVVIPKDDAPDEEKTAFYKKLGWTDDKNAYVVERGAETKLEEKFVSDMKDFAHDNKIPLGTAQKMVSFMEEQAKFGETLEKTSLETQITAGLDKVKAKYGQAYPVKRAMARKVLAEIVDDSEVAAAFNDPALGSNPYVLEALIKVAEKVYKEDDFRGGTQFNAGLSPTQAQDKINSIMADKKHAYHKGDKAATAEMTKLYEMKRG